MNLYNEINPFMAQWLRNLIAAGLIPPGVVWECSIEDIKPEDLRDFRQCHFFAGLGGWSLAARAAGISDDEHWWSASCPCQPFSAAGAGAGFADERHLWPVVEHLARECRPARIVGEQVASKDAEIWLDLVQTDLEILEYAFGAVAFPSASIGAPHIRDRTYWVADAKCTRIFREPGSFDSAQAGARDRQHLHDSVAGGDVGGLDDAHHQGLEGQRGGYQAAQRHGQGSIRPVAAAGKSGGLADTDGGQQGYGGLQRLSEHGLAAADGSALRQGSGGPQSGAVRMADDTRDGRREQRPDDSGGDKRGEAQKLEQRLGGGGVRGAASERPGPTNGFWAAADWLACRDGKWRPVEPGTFPLAHGLPAGLGSLSAGERRLAEMAGLDAASLKRAKTYRTESLRGYGNAINIEQARMFLECVFGI